jgi:SpoVK/Ycf46/Vps4 family AAA+-type ATPase
MTTYSFRQTQKIVLFEVANQQDRAADPKNHNVLCIPGIFGPVGCGKTALAQGVADEFGLPVFNVNCGETADATDITGFPLPSEVVRSENGNYVPWTLNEAMHIACTQPCVLFFDDIDKLPPTTEGALIGLFGKREIKGHRLHAKTILIAAGNRVGDDRLAHQLSESMRLRLTPIVMTPSLSDFKAYARATEKVHPVVLGYLDYQPPHLHAWRDDVLRFPCQRSWTEASALMFATEDQKSLVGGKENDAWQTIVELKCGAQVSADFWAWYSLTRKVDVKKLLTEGDLAIDVEEKDRVMAQYAAVFAVSMELNNRGVKKEYSGLEVFLSKVTPELRVAAITQLQPNVRQQIAKLFPKAGDVLLQDLLRRDDE